MGDYLKATGRADIAQEAEKYKEVTIEFCSFSKKAIP
jgi:hypothetical protein